MTANEPNPIDQLIDIASGDADPQAGDALDAENRSRRRLDWTGPLAFVQWTPEGVKSIATIVQCRNISSTGLSVVSRYMLHTGHEGVVLMKRSNGEEVMLGVKVVHCSYVGDMNHQSGLRFIDVPDRFSLDDFRDEQGNMLRVDLDRAA